MIKNNSQDACMDNSKLSFILSFIHSFTQVEIPVVSDVHGDEHSLRHTDLPVMERTPSAMPGG